MTRTSLVVLGAAGVVALASCATMEKAGLGSESATALSGKWNGTYTCVQGLTGLTLTMSGNWLGNVEGTFEFYPTPQNPRVPAGKYNMKGTYSKGTLVLSGQSWVDRPKSYMMVGLNGRVASTPEGQVFSGTVPECREPFHLKKEL
jgi:hypothetical protein